MVIDWDKPLRTVDTHFPVEVICKKWRHAPTETGIAVRIVRPLHDGFYRYTNRGTPLLHGGPRLENVPDTRYIYVESGKVGEVFLTKAAAEEHGKSRLGSTGWKVYKIELTEQFLS